MSAAPVSIVLPELAVPARVLVLSLPATLPPASAVSEWVELDPGLPRHREELLRLVTVAGGEPQPGEVAAFLSYRDLRGRLIGGTALLTLELIEATDGAPSDRVGQLAGELRRSADRLGHGALAEVDTRRTASGVPAARLRFLTILSARAGEAAAPMVEACRWFYPVPGRPDLAWSLVFHTTDLAEADQLIGEFDQLAASLTWAGP